MKSAALFALAVLVAEAWHTYPLKVEAEPAFQYSAAFVDYRRALQVFPLTGKEFSLPLPL